MAKTKDKSKAKREPGERQVFIGHLETRSFDFVVYATSEKEAQTLMRKAWRVHCKHYPADPGYLTEYWGDFYVQALTIPCVVRDSTVIVGKERS